MTPRAGGSAPTSITVLYDEACALCRRCRAWMETQPTWIPVDFLPATAADARERRPDLPWLGTELVVVGDHGEVWVGTAAFLLCLWATVDYRAWSFRLSGPAFAPVAERFFHMVSSNRGRIGAVVGSRDCPDGACRHRVEAPPRPPIATRRPLPAPPPRERVPWEPPPPPPPPWASAGLPWPE